ncbi:MAG: hypothetical protein ACWGPS_00295 [Candidatus Promineifilaceae bacterium]
MLLSQSASSGDKVGDDNSARAPSVSPETPALPLEGQVVLLIGGTRSGDRQLIRSLAARGADIVLVYLHEIDGPVRQLQREVGAYGRRCLIITGLLMNETFARQVIDQVLHTFGRIDIFLDLSTTSTHGTAWHKYGGLNAVMRETEPGAILPNPNILSLALSQMLQQPPS